MLLAPALTDRKFPVYLPSALYACFVAAIVYRVGEAVLQCSALCLTAGLSVRARDHKKRGGEFVDGGAIKLFSDNPIVLSVQEKFPYQCP
ncbi:hypothetical protein [Nitrosomonas aestuarii]|uniref:hypothetical protein n=1 Tax=Nitrosomonas aestuarii TaxID=52441 RepID=UPI000B8712B6|nr:hypothetical protein [Nitrosomonas aestuarii]